MKKVIHDAKESIKKFRVPAIVLLIGLSLMVIPIGEKKTPSVSEEKEMMPQVTLEEELEAILAGIDGAGEVCVLLSIAQGEEMIYQIDEDLSVSDGGTDRSTSTVTVTMQNKDETPVVRKTIPPQYLGAIVTCQGAERPVVRLAIVEAVSKITGLGADRISVLKMK